MLPIGEVSNIVLFAERAYSEECVYAKVPLLDFTPGGVMLLKVRMGRVLAWPVGSPHSGP